MQESNITVIGTVVQEPKFSITKNGVACCSVRVAVNERRFEKETSSWIDGDSSYFTLTCWRYLAENVAQSITKGDPIVASGKLRVREWKTEEKSGIAVEPEATSLGHDLSRGTSVLTKNRRGTNSEAEVDGLSVA